MTFIKAFFQEQEEVTDKMVEATRKCKGMHENSINVCRKKVEGDQSPLTS